MRTAGPWGSATRPRRAYRTDPVTRALRWASWGIVAVGVGTVAALYDTLPRTVPTHFDITGRADQFGDRTSVLWLPVVWVLLQGLVTWLSTRPQRASYPVPVTDENAQDLYRHGERLVVWTGLAMAVAFGGVVALMVTGTRGWAALVGAGVVALLAACVVGVGRMLRHSPGRPR